MPEAGNDEAKSSRQIIEGYELIRKLGEGGMGAVYLARQLSMDRMVALKVLRRNLARNQDFVGRFVREARLAGKLDHENIVRALDVGESGDYHYLAMDYVDGQNLSAILAEEGALEEGRALEIALQLARALEHAHAHGIIHRDVKPDNVMVTADGTVKLTDLGLARQTGEETHITQTGTMVGTPHYVSPEQARGAADVDIRGDIYSLGATLYRLVTGRTLFDGPTAAVVMSKHLTEEPPPAREVNPEVSEHTSRLIAKAMVKDRARRYQTPAQMIEDLELVISGKAPVRALSVKGVRDTRRTRPVSAVRRRGRTTRGEQPVEERRRLPLPLPALAGIAAGVLLLGGLGIWALTRGGDGPPEKPPEVVKPPEKPPEEKPPPEDPPEEKNFEEMFTYAEKHWQENPGDYDAAIAKFKQVEGAATGTVWSMKAGDAVKAVEKARAAAADAAFAAVRKKADALAAAGDYDAAVATYGEPPEKLAALLKPRYRQAAKALAGSAEGKIGAALAAAEKLSAAGEPEKGLAELAKVAALKYVKLAGKLAALRARLGKEKENVAALAQKRLRAQAREALKGVLAGFDELVLGGDYAGAEKLLAAERKKLGAETVALVAAEFTAAEKIAAALAGFTRARKGHLATLPGKQVVLTKRDKSVHRVTVKKLLADGLFVEREYRMMGQVRKVGYAIKFADLAAGELDRLLPAFKPAGADGQLAAALLAMSAKDYAGAAKSLDAAGKHPLAARYRDRLDVLKLGEIEAAAKAAWEKGVEVREKYDLAGAKRLLAALDAFGKAHGKTKFAGGHADEIEKLKGLARAAIEASPEGITAKVRKLYRGKVVSFDPRTRTVELLYDFADLAQLEDWTLSHFAAGAKTGRNMKIEKGRLHLIRTGRCALLTGMFKSMSISADFDFNGKGIGDVTVLVCADDRGNWYNLFGLQGGKQSYMERYIAGKWKPLGKKQASPFAAARRGTMSLTYRDGHLTGRVGGLVLNHKDKTYPYGRVGLWAFDTHASYDNVRVTGVLEEAWLEGELARLAARSVPASVFRADWRELKLAGDKPKGRIRATAGLIYDAKRKRCVLFGGSRINDLWTLDLAAGRWAQLEKNDYGAAGGPVRPRKLHFYNLLYDSGSDAYWAMDSSNCWIYSPASRTWKDHGLAGMPNWHSGSVRSGWTYDPDGRRVMRIYQGGRAAYFYYPAGGKVEKLPTPPATDRGYVDGGAVYDRKNKVLVVFGGSGAGAEETHTYDPRIKKWRRLRPAKSPPKRQYHRLVWHDKLGAVVLFGGLGKKWEDDLWVLETAAERWTQVKTAKGPPALECATAYDAARDAVVLFNKNGGTWVLRLARVGGKK